MDSNHYSTSYSRLYNALAFIFLCLFLKTLVNLYAARLKIHKLKTQGLHMAPHNLLLGHLPVANEILSQLPSNANSHYLPGEVRRKYPEVGPVFYLDMWPFSLPLLVVASPSAAYQFTQEHSQPKAEGLRKLMRPFTGNNDLVSMEGPLWKKWRSVFNPGFSAGHLITLVPDILDGVSTFCEILRGKVRQDKMFRLEEVTVNLTLDIIGKVALGTHFNAQRSKHDFVSALRSQIKWLSFGAELNPFKRWNPIRPLAHWYYTHVIYQYIARELENRFASRQESIDTSDKKLPKSKTIVDLALDTYLEEQTGLATTSKMDATFEKFAVSQMKIFILAGHDTTSSTLCYIFYLLSKNPPALQRIRAEHDAVFGSSLAETPSVILCNPHTLNQIPNTLAVIKEALRLFPPASSVRDGDANFALTHDGRQYPTEGCIVWSLHQAMHREPLYWPEPDTFLPERWLVPQGDPLYPVKGAWRPFEFGPRNCIGQELAMLEIKLVLAMTVREFEVQACYEEWDRGKGRWGPTMVNGEKAYQSAAGTVRPRDGFPCRVAAAVKT